MKKLTLVAISLFSFFLVSCGASLPAKSSAEVGTGVLAVPKSMKSEVSYNAGWATELEIRDANGEVVGDLIRLYPISGRQFVFVNALSPGNYTVSGFRRVAIGGNAVRSASPIHKLGEGIPFTINDGEVSVLPVVFHVYIKSTGVNQGSSHIQFLPLEDKELEKFKARMAKANKKNEWDVKWP